VSLALNQIERTDRGRKRLDAALCIYRETILPEAQNPEKQILYWIDHCHDDLRDEFRCFSIEQDEKIVGYLQYSYFREEHLFFFEYLCLRDPKRGLAPSGAIERIEEFLADNYDPSFTIAFEVAHVRDDAGAWQPDKKLVKYFRRLAFRNVDFDYHYPILQSYDGPMSYPADLMVRLPDGRTSISSCELRTILRCIYFKHYLRWDRPFLDAQKFSRREQLINELYSKEVTRISGGGPFSTTGDDRRSFVERFKRSKEQILPLLGKIFGPKMPRLIVVIGIMLFAQWALARIMR
jgi:hypothetical protein